MNTRQKLTLGVAAIFMVTLTIVGVTYAYFVTRVTGALTESANIQTAKVGAIVYQSGNGTGDSITISDVEPGAVRYKTFSVTNTDPNAAGDFKLYLESTPTSSPNNKPQFVHTSSTRLVDRVTSPDTTDADCYPHTSGTPVTAASLYNSLGENISTNVTESTPTPTTACFAGTYYNNIFITLYKFTSQSASEAFVVDAYGVSESSLSSTTTVMSESRVKANAGIVYTTASQYLNNDDDQNATIALAGGETNFYVLKIEYFNNSMNQNIENDAELTLKVNIK